jgi:hypothetical protein
LRCRNRISCRSPSCIYISQQLGPYREFSPSWHGTHGSRLNSQPYFGTNPFIGSVRPGTGPGVGCRIGRGDGL